MRWLGKAIGGIVGFAAARVPGSLVGILLGHQFDQYAGRSASGRRRSSATQAISELFFAVVFEVMGRLAKIDGRVSEDEINIARRIMDEMRLTPQQVREAIEHFSHGKQADYPQDERLARLADEIGGRDELALAFMQIQIQAAAGAGPIDPEKRRELWRIAARLNVDRAALAQIEALVRAHLAAGAARPAEAAGRDEAYRVLGLQPSATDAEVKAAYRRLMNRHHPDKLVARGLPESMAAVAEQKTREIRAAYERIKAERRFK